MTSSSLPAPLRRRPRRGAPPPLLLREDCGARHGALFRSPPFDVRAASFLWSRRAFPVLFSLACEDHEGLAYCTGVLQLAVGVVNSFRALRCSWINNFILAFASSVFSFCFETSLVLEHEKQDQKQDLPFGTFWLMTFFESVSLIGSQEIKNVLKCIRYQSACICHLELPKIIFVPMSSEVSGLSHGSTLIGGKCKVSWIRLTRPKKHGGLGIPHLDKFSRALRLRWLWQEAKMSASQRMVKDLPCTTMDKRLFAAATLVTVGDGKPSLFWESAWLGSKSSP